VQLARLIEEDPTLVHATDANGWLAIHEAARYGHLDCLTYLHEKGADINAVSGPGGGTPLYWALDNHPKDHPVVQYLEKNGALNYYGP
jgi:ankyrin repeat protein